MQLAEGSAAQKIPCSKCSFPITVPQAQPEEASKDRIDVHCECGQQFRIPRSRAGTSMKCPSCKASLTPYLSPVATTEQAVTASPEDVNPAETESEAGDSGGSGTRECPFCGEAIPAKAIKCKVCGEFLLKAHVRTVQVAAPQSGPRWDQKSFVNIFALLAGILVVIGTFLPLVTVGFLTKSFINSVQFGEGAGVLALGALAAILGLINIFARRNLEVTFLVAGALATLESGWVLYQFRRGGLETEFIGPAPYLILGGGIALLVVGLIGTIMHANSAADVGNRLPQRRIRPDQRS